MSKSYKFKTLNSNLYQVVCMFRSQINPTLNRLLCDEDFEVNPNDVNKHEYLQSLLDYNEYKRFYKLTGQIHEVLDLKLSKGKIENDFNTEEDALNFLSLFISKTHAKNFYNNVDISGSPLPTDLYCNTNYDKLFGKIWTFILRTISHNLRTIVKHKTLVNPLDKTTEKDYKITVDDFHKLFLSILFIPDLGTSESLRSTISSLDMHIWKYLNLI